MLAHWGRVTHICVSKLTIISSDNGLSPGRRQAIIWTNAEISLIGPLGTNFSEILVGIQTFSFRKMHLKVSSVLQRPFCLSLNESTNVCHRSRYFPEAAVLWSYTSVLLHLHPLPHPTKWRQNCRRYTFKRNIFGGNYLVSMICFHWNLFLVVYSISGYLEFR